MKKTEKDDKSNTVPELIIDEFDVEQIWQQIELQNVKILDASLLHVSKLLAAKDSSLLFNFNESSDSTRDYYNVDDQNNSENSDKEDDSSCSDKSNNINEIDNSEHENNSDNSNVSEVDSDLENEKKEKKNARKYKKSVVDDDFFKLDEMEQFLKQEESVKSKKKIVDSDESDEESVDLFNPDLDDDSEDDSKVNPKYNDFFEDDEVTNDFNQDNQTNDSDKNSEDNSELELSDLEIEENKNEKKSEMKKSDSSEDDEEDIKDKEVKSSLEVREERLKKKIEQIEDAALQEKSWQLKGEITANNRPQNSLLEEVVEFDLTSRPGNIK